MFDLTDGWQVAGLIGAVVVIFGVGTLLFQAGCALADVVGPSYFKSLLVYGVAVVVCVPLAGLLLYLAGLYDTEPGALGTYRLLALVVWLLAAWVVSAIIYSLFLTAPFRKGLVIAGTELFLAALLSGLVTAVVLVVLALVQIGRGPPAAPRSALAPPHAPISALS